MREDVLRLANTIRTAEPNIPVGASEVIARLGDNLMTTEFLTKHKLTEEELVGFAKEIFHQRLLADGKGQRAAEILLRAAENKLFPLYEADEQEYVRRQIQYISK